MEKVVIDEGKVGIQKVYFPLSLMNLIQLHT